MAGMALPMGGPQASLYSDAPLGRAMSQAKAKSGMPLPKRLVERRCMAPMIALGARMSTRPLIHLTHTGHRAAAKRL